MKNVAVLVAVGVKGYRTNVVGCFPDGNSALMLVAARLRYIAGTKWVLVNTSR